MTENTNVVSQPEEPSISPDAIPAFSPDHRSYLELAQASLREAGFYAYLMIDDQQRWTAAADDEAGRVDVRLEGREFAIEVCGSSPGLFMEEDSEWRRTALERLARRVIPNIARGMLEPHQRAYWNEDDRGVAVCISRTVPIEEPEQVSTIARSSLDHLEELQTLIESELRT